MKRIVIATFISLFSLVSILAFSADNIEKVKRNMTKTQVSDLMGKPSLVVNQGTDPNGKALEVWKYGEDTEITFIDGKVDAVLSSKPQPK